MPNPRQEVEAATAAPATTPQQGIQAAINRYKPVIVKLLHGTGINVETFTAWTANAMRAQDQLWHCDQATVLGAVLKAAQMGLAPNDSRNLCTIIPRRNKDTGRQEAHFQLGYGGVMELARRAVPGLRFDGRPVYPGDEFSVDFLADEFHHVPAAVLGQDRGGDAYVWYVRAIFPDGSTQIEVLNRADVQYHRSFSKQPDGLMWTKSYDAAALKSCVLQMKRWLPASAQLVAGLAADERVHTPETVDADTIDVGPVEHQPDQREEPTYDQPAAP